MDSPHPAGSRMFTRIEETQSRPELRAGSYHPGLTPKTSTEFKTPTRSDPDSKYEKSPGYSPRLILRTAYMSKPPSYPREGEQRSPRARPETEPQSLYVSEQNSKSFVSQRSEAEGKTYERSVPQREFEDVLKQREVVHQHEMERQRIAMLEQLDRKMKDYEESLRREFQQRLDFLEQKATEKSENDRALLDLKGQITAKTLSEEVIRRHYEEQLTDLADQKSSQANELARLQHLVKLQGETESEQVKDLHLEVEHLTQDIANSDSQTRQLRELVASQAEEINTLSAKLQHKARLETDYTNLAKELTEEKLRNKREGDGDLKLRLQTLEHEHQLLRRDYDTLASMHKRALKDLKRSAEENKVPVKAESVDVRKQYETKCAELSEEATVWKEKTRKLVSRYYHALEKLQRDNKQLKSDLARLAAETQQSVHEIHSMLEKRQLMDPSSKRPPARAPKPAIRKLSPSES